MTCYHGGKSRSANSIASCILSYINKHDLAPTVYIEPFCGMASVLGAVKRTVPGLASFSASDASGSVIAMWRAIQQGWIPPSTCSLEEFMALKYDKTTTAEKGYIGHRYSYGGSYFASFVDRAKSLEQADAYVQNFVKKARDTADGVVFTQQDYKDAVPANTEGAIVYCDPPYYNTYRNYYDDNRKAIAFKTDEFWEWVFKVSVKNTVFVSEASVPEHIQGRVQKVYSSTFSDVYHRENATRDHLWVVYK